MESLANLDVDENELRMKGRSQRPVLPHNDAHSNIQGKYHSNLEFGTRSVRKIIEIDSSIPPSA